MLSVPFTLVFVCTANRARSPVAEAIARGLLGDDVIVRSRGSRAVDGLPPLPEAVLAAGRIGVDISQHRSRLLDRASVHDADLVVGFERIHLASSVVELDVPRERAFTLAELVGLLSGDPSTSPDAARSAVAAAASKRQTRTAEEVPDPIGKPQEIFDQVVARIDALTRQLVLDLFGVR